MLRILNQISRLAMACREIFIPLSSFEAAVIGVPDSKWGEVGKAFVSLRPGKQATEQDLIEDLKGKIANFKIPKTVEYLQVIPRSAAGKILKNDLRKKYWGGEDRAVH